MFLRIRQGPLGSPGVSCMQAQGPMHGRKCSYSYAPGDHSGTQPKAYGRQRGPDALRSEQCLVAWTWTHVPTVSKGAVPNLH